VTHGVIRLNSVRFVVHLGSVDGFSRLLCDAAVVGSVIAFHVLPQNGNRCTERSSLRNGPGG
jgi:hypothetical protein